MILRRANADDAAALTDVLEAAYAPFQSLGLPPVTAGVAEEISQHNVWVAEVAGQVRGGLVLVLNTQAHIANLAVHPDAGGHGIGKALINVAVAASAAAGHKSVQLATHAQMTDTHAFYRKVGLVETGRDGNKVYFTLELN